MTATSQVVTALLTTTEPVTTRELGRLLGWPPTSVATQLRHLSRSGDVRKFGRGTGACYALRRERAA